MAITILALSLLLINLILKELFIINYYSVIFVVYNLYKTS